MFRQAIERIRRVTPRWLGGYRVRWGPVKMWIVPAKNDLDFLAYVAEPLLKQEELLQVVVTRGTVPQVLLGTDLRAEKEWPRAFGYLLKKIAKFDPPGESQMHYRLNGVDMMVTRRGADEVVITRLPKSAKSPFEIPVD